MESFWNTKILSKVPRRLWILLVPTYYDKSEYTDISSNYTTIEYLRSQENSTTENPSILFLSAIAGKDSYGPERKIHDFIAVLNTIAENQDSLHINMALLCNDFHELQNVITYIESKSETLSQVYGKITIISAPFLDKNQGFARDQRKAPQSQRLRRRMIARTRNFLLLNSLRHEQYTLFVDSDIIEFEHPETFLLTFIKTNKDIIVPRIPVAGNPDYDLNSWRGQRRKPTEEQLKLLDVENREDFHYYPEEADIPGKVWHFKEYIANTNNEYEEHKDEYEYLVPLDSVGGAVLFAKSIVYKQGAIFPTSYIVGTTWDRSEGYDGIETEGLCYLAKPLGYSCW
ncbi:uncharacterized protein J8A68_006007, partial [[Candida] subhashii]